MNPVPRLLSVVIVTAALTAGLAACSSGGSDQPKAAQPAAFVRLDPEQFASQMGDTDAEVINVHIPYEGELEETDAIIPFDRILGDSRLPADKDSKLLLYCMTGRMSETAGTALLKAGYTDVSHLEGGMRAWEAAGKTLVNNPEESTGTEH